MSEPRSSHSRLRRWWPAATLAVAALVAAAVFLALSNTSAQSVASQTALAYGRRTMTWIKGPSIESEHTVRLGHLRPALDAYVPLPTREDVNTPALIRQFGPNRRVALVVLHGTFNSLPPDEGVTVHGTVVVIVDMQSNHVLFMQD